jgi:hypothetical protein
LGDSIPAGTTVAVSFPFTDIRYPQFLFGHLLEEDVGFDKLVNLACPADSSAQFLNGNVLTKLSPAEGSYCYGDVTPAAVLSPSISELAAAQAGGVRLIPAGGCQDCGGHNGCGSSYVDDWSQ